MEFKGYCQSKGIVSRLLYDPEQLGGLADIRSGIEAAMDNATTGGVSIMDSINENDIIWDEEEVLTPERPAVLATIPVHQQKWPALGGYGVNKSGSAMQVEKAFSKLTMKASYPTKSTHHTNKTSNLQTSDTASDPPTAWVNTSSSQKLFPDAESTPPTDEWAARFKEAQQMDKSHNILAFQFWNPASKDYDPERFRHPLIERYICPFNPKCP